LPIEYLSEIARSVLAGKLILLTIATITTAAAITTIPSVAMTPRSEKSAPGDFVRLPGHTMAGLGKATLASGSRYNQPLTLTLILRRSDSAGFERYLNDIYNPHSIRFRRFLSPRQVSDRFGPSPETYDALSAYLKEKGFEITALRPTA
jgi:hypothetical protein